MVDDEVQLNAGRATAFSLQQDINLSKLSPVTTPGGTIPCNPGIFSYVMFYFDFGRNKNTAGCSELQSKHKSYVMSKCDDY